jgi:glycosyltransferase involved in cell wall biosynthesis
MSTVLVVPCFNEASRLNGRKFESFLGEHPDVSIVFVNDGSTDRTAEAIEVIAKQLTRVSCLHLSRNLGKGDAVREGILLALTASPEFVGYWDSDLALPLTAMRDIWKPLREDSRVCIAIGSRVQMMGSRIERRAYRHYLGRIFATGAALSLGIPIYDTQCGAKLFRAGPELRKVLREPFASPWAFDVELLARFCRLFAEHGIDCHDAIREVPLRQWRDVAGSKLNLWSAARMPFELLRIHRRYRRPKRTVNAVRNAVAPTPQATP